MMPDRNWRERHQHGPWAEKDPHQTPFQTFLCAQGSPAWLSSCYALQTGAILGKAAKVVKPDLKYYLLP